MSEANAKPRRHWFQFSLRTLLIAVTLVAGLLVAWRTYVTNSERSEMSGSPIISHPHYHEGGPPTLEFVLPVERNSLDVSSESLDRTLDRFFQHDTLTSADIHRDWNLRVARLKFPLAKGLASRISEYSPYSLVIFEDIAWIAFKKNSAFSQTTGYGNAVLVPFFEDPVPDTVGRFRRNDHAEVFEYLDEFRNLTPAIPPIYFGDPSVVEEGKDFPIKGIEPWIGSLIVSVLSDGVHLLYRADGQFGRCWYDGVEEISEAEFWELNSENLFDLEDMES